MFYADSLYSLYIHWPFCSSKCYYCDFVAFEQHEDFHASYHSALIKEIKLFVQNNPSYNKNITTIFIGGGTPSLYPLELMEKLFDTLKKYFNFTKIQEVSIEANPADITEEKLDAWKSFGITRLSIGTQVLDNNTLFSLNRRQRVRDVHLAAKIVPKYFDNYSIDLILGLPNVTQEIWENTVNKVVNWQPQHISLYFLTIHEKTPLYFQIKRNDTVLPDDDIIVSAYKKTVKLFEDHGFKQYEISNFAQPGYASIHNQAYWNRLPYKGFGIGACSFDGNRRSTNEKNLQRYITSLLKYNETPFFFEEKLSLQEERIEEFMLQLRQKKGMDLHRMIYLLNKDKRKRFYAKIKDFENQKLIKNNNGIITLTIRGMIFENEVLAQLI